VSSSFTVVFDACVLYPAQLRDLLMHLAVTDLFRAKWSARIHEEWITAVLKQRPDLHRDQLERTRQLMDKHVRDCLVTGYEHLIDGLFLPDPNDRHILAVAIRSSASLIVTENLRDFPSTAIIQYGVEAITADDFLADLFDLDVVVVMAAIKQHKQSLKNPAKTWNQYLDSLEAAGMRQTVGLIRQHLPQLLPAAEIVND
jgi:predicted nucleic acid-binding protein